jgi:adenylate cyclase
MRTFLQYTLNGQAHEVECQPAMTIGRDESCDIVLPDPRVSRRHALLYRTQDGSSYLADEASSNGCFVNAVRIQRPTRLNDGDRFSIGAVDFQFHQPRAATRAGVPDGDPRRTTLIVSPGVELLRIAILVADIRGFTRLSEALSVGTLTELMNQWFREAGQCVRARDGLVDKFLGDCVYARWEANRDPAGSLRHALDAAVELNRMTERLNALNPELPQKLAIGVGVNVGNAALGTDQGRTAIGDAVNLTFRLQEMTRQLDCHILLSRDAYQYLPADCWRGREQDIAVAGRTRPVAVWAMSFEDAQQLLRLAAHGGVRDRE